MLSQVDGKCKHPLHAFGALLKVGRALAGCVYDMCEQYTIVKPQVDFKSENMPVASDLRATWLRWKMQQVCELSRHGRDLYDTVGRQLRMRKSAERRSSFDLA